MSQSVGVYAQSQVKQRDHIGLLWVVELLPGGQSLAPHFSNIKVYAGDADARIDNKPMTVRPTLHQLPKDSQL